MRNIARRNEAPGRSRRRRDIALEGQRHLHRPPRLQARRLRLPTVVNRLVAIERVITSAQRVDDEVDVPLAGVRRIEVQFQAVLGIHRPVPVRYFRLDVTRRRIVKHGADVETVSIVADPHLGLRGGLGAAAEHDELADSARLRPLIWLQQPVNVRCLRHQRSTDERGRIEIHRISMTRTHTSDHKGQYRQRNQTVAHLGHLPEARAISTREAGSWHCRLSVEAIILCRRSPQHAANIGMFAMYPRSPCLASTIFRLRPGLCVFPVSVARSGRVLTRRQCLNSTRQCPRGGRRAELQPHDTAPTAHSCLESVPAR